MIFLSSLLFANNVFGYELTREDLAVVYVTAISSTHYPLPQVPPEIHIVSPDQLRGAVALYKDKLILISNKLDMGDFFNRTVLLHEMVHYLQDNAKGPAKDCQEWLLRENEAYKVQNMALEQYGHPKRALNLSQCI